ncbi:hypothetical protein [Nonomuraea sp. NPDC048901]|uniref:hypothetical protein n=1 Tax=Nonomuraea sp. NPDC048901 TaxID=3155627 RepID=UPI00340DA197
MISTSYQAALRLVDCWTHHEREHGQGHVRTSNRSTAAVAGVNRTAAEREIFGPRGERSSPTGSVERRRAGRHLFRLVLRYGDRESPTDTTGGDHDRWLTAWM